MTLPALLNRLPRTLLALTFTAVLALTAQAQGSDEAKVLNVYNWSDYIAEDTLKNFEKETGIKVRYDNYDNNEILHAKLVAGKTGYDIVVPGAHFAKTQIEGGLLQKLDRAQLSNWNNLDPAVLEQMAKVDPGNQYLVNWLWGYVTVGINTGKVKAALGGTPMPANPWALIFDPQYAGKLKACGVNLLDSASEVLPVAMDLCRQGRVQQERQGLRRRARGAGEGPAQRHALLVVGLHQRPGHGLAVRGDGLFGRHQHRPPARHRRQERPGHPGAGAARPPPRCSSIRWRSPRTPST
jgi:hypothetical protein